MKIDRFNVKTYINREIMKNTEIQDLIKFVAKSGVSEVEIQDKDFKIVIKTAVSKKETQTIIQTALLQLQFNKQLLLHKPLLLQPNQQNLLHQLQTMMQNM